MTVKGFIRGLMGAIAVMALVCVVHPSPSAAADPQWTSLGSSSSLGTQVFATAVDSTGTLYAAGSTSSGGFVAKWTGSAWETLATANGWVRALAFASSGAMFVGGEFTNIAGTSANRIAKFDGSTWAALGTGVDSGILALAIDASNNVFVGGGFTTAGGTSARHIAKWSSSTSTWSSLGTATAETETAGINAVLVHGDNLYVGGQFKKVSTTSALNVAMWNGSSWTSLGIGNQYNSVKALAMDGSGTLFAGGTFSTAGSVSVSNIAKWDGSAWAALGTGLNSSVQALTFDGAGNLYAGGGFTKAGESSALRVAKWNGSAWSALGSGVTTGADVQTLSASGVNLFAGSKIPGSGFDPSSGAVSAWNGADDGLTRITSISPATGSVAGGISVVITGANLTGATAVTFDGKAATEFKVDSGTQITAVTPPGTAVATVDVKVAAPAGTATKANGFGYVKGTQTVTWAPTTAITTVQSPLTPSTAASALDNATITYAVVEGFTMSTCTVDAGSGTLTYTGTGTCTVRATAAETNSYQEATKDVTFTSSLSAQTVTWAPTTAVTTLQSPLTPSASASALGNAPITYSVKEHSTSSCTVDADRGTLTYTGSGTCTVTAKAAATNVYAQGTKDVAFTVSRATPTFTWSPTLAAEVPDGSITFEAATTSSDGAVNYAVTKAGSTGCTVDSATRKLTFTAAGSCEVTATVPQTSTYLAAAATETFSISRSSNVVTWSPSSSLSLATTSRDLGSASSTSGGAITYSATSSGSEGCTFTNPAVPALTYAASGSCTVTATSAQTDEYAQGTTSSTVTITRADPTITWNPVTSLKMPAATVSPTAATTTGDGEITYAVTSEAGAGCTVDAGSGRLTYSSVGQCEVTATTATTTRYTSASTSKVFTVALSTQSLTLRAESTSLVVGGTSTLTTSGSSGSGAVTFTVSSGAGVCRVNGSTLTALTAGRCTVTATIAADASYGSASDSVTITVTAPAVTPSGGGSSGESSGGSSGGSGAGTVSVPTSQTVVSPTLTAPVNPVSRIPERPAIVPVPPSVVPTQNSGLAVVNGQLTTVAVTRSPSTVTVRIEGTPASFSLDRPASTSGRTDAFVTGVPTTFTAEGFQPGSLVSMFAMSTPVLVSTAVADADGRVAGLVTLPTSLSMGRHTLVVSGYLPSGEALSSYVGIATRAAPSTLVSRVFFPVDSAALTPAMKARLAELVTALRGRAPTTVTVGVVRAVNPTNADHALALKRARAVTAYLRAKGLPGTVTVGASIPTRLTTWSARRADVTATLN